MSKGKHMRVDEFARLTDSKIPTIRKKILRREISLPEGRTDRHHPGIRSRSPSSATFAQQFRSSVAKGRAMMSAVATLGVGKGLIGGRMRKQTARTSKMRDPGEPRILIPHEGGYPAQSLTLRPNATDGVTNWICKWKVFTSNDKTVSHRCSIAITTPKETTEGGSSLGDSMTTAKTGSMLNSGKLPLDPRKLPLSISQEKTFLVEVVTVRKDSKRLLLPPSFPLVKISRVIRPLEEGRTLGGVARTTAQFCRLIVPFR